MTDFNGVVASIVAISIAANGFFLRGVARRIDQIDARQREHGDRITWLESRSHTPRRRASDTRFSGETDRPEDS